MILFAHLQKEGNAMADQSYAHHFIARILRLMRHLEETHLDISQFMAEGQIPSHLSPEEQREFQAAMENISLLDEIPGGFFVYYAGGDEELIHANRGCLRLFQCETLQEFRELTGNSFRGVVYHEDLEEVEASIHSQIHGAHGKMDYVEYRIRRKDGSIGWVEDYGYFTHEESIGDIFYVFVADATEKHRQQDLLRREHHLRKQMLMEALEKADAAVKAKNAFLSHISHEMRTPLNAIFGFTTLAKTAVDDPVTLVEYLDQVEIAGRQLLDMITQALDVSALSDITGTVQEECDLLDTLQEVYNFLLPQAEEKEIDFSLDCTLVTHRSVYTDEKRFKQLVLNLANNAITYTNKGGRVEIALTEEKSLPDNHAIYRLEVKDTGVGIGEEFLEDVFEPFSRAKTSSLSEVRGIGLGLTIVKNIVDTLKGTISVKTAVNEGSVFTVTIPLHIQAMQGEAGDEEAESILRILLAEDNPVSREIETDLLERMGFVVNSMEDGIGLLDRMRKASSKDYDLIILDLQMPGMDGWQVAREIRKLPDPAVARIPIIALTANVSEAARQKSLDSGINAHLAKPMDLNLLLETMEKLTKKSIT